MTTVSVSGFDLFFTKISRTEANRLLGAFNSMDLLWDGVPLRWTLEFGKRRATFTTRYEPKDWSVTELMAGLSMNRVFCEGIASRLGIEFVGSEFYTQFQNSDHQQQFIAEMDSTMSVVH